MSAEREPCEHDWEDNLSCESCEGHSFVSCTKCDEWYDLSCEPDPREDPVAEDLSWPGVREGLVEAVALLRGLRDPQTAAAAALVLDQLEAMSVEYECGGDLDPPCPACTVFPGTQRCPAVRRAYGGPYV